MDANAVARKIVGDWVVHSYGVPSLSLYDKIKAGDLVTAIEKELTAANLQKRDMRELLGEACNWLHATAPLHARTPEIRDLADRCHDAYEGKAADKQNPVIGRAGEEVVKPALSPKNCPNCNGYSYHADKCPNG